MTTKDIITLLYILQHLCTAAARVGQVPEEAPCHSGPGRATSRSAPVFPS